jgi:hypothetical protein
MYNLLHNLQLEVDVNQTLVASAPPFDSIDDYLRFIVCFTQNMHWNNSPRLDMSLHSDTLSWFRVDQSLLFLSNAACLAENQQIPII